MGIEKAKIRFILEKKNAFKQRIELPVPQQLRCEKKMNLTIMLYGTARREAGSVSKSLFFF